MVNEDIVNIICWPVNFGYFENIWSWVEFVRPSIRRLSISVEQYRGGTRNGGTGSISLQGRVSSDG